jgi:peptidoglycan hydrolase CwlO-like protein
LTNAINALNTAKSDITSGISTINYKIDVANTFREQRKEFQSEIWGLRQQIASYRADIINYEKALNYLGVSTVTNVIL